MNCTMLKYVIVRELRHAAAFPRRNHIVLQPLSWPVLDSYQCFECFDFFFKEMIGKIWENVWNLPKQFDFFSTLNSVEPGWTWMQDEHPVVASVCESCRFGRNDVIIRSCRAASMAVWGELKWHQSDTSTNHQRALYHPYKIHVGATFHTSSEQKPVTRIK